MKYSEIHRRFIAAGWRFLYSTGSHYFYEKDGVKSEPVPYHGAKEIGKGLANKIIKKYGI